MNSYNRVLLPFFLIVSLLASSPTHGFAWGNLWSAYKKPIIGTAMVAAAIMGVMAYRWYRGGKNNNHQASNEAIADLESSLTHVAIPDIAEDQIVQDVKNGRGKQKRVKFQDELFLNERRLWEYLKDNAIYSSDGKNRLDDVKLDSKHGHVFKHDLGDWLVHPVALQQMEADICGYILLATAKAIDDLFKMSNQANDLSIEHINRNRLKISSSSKNCSYNIRKNATYTFERVPLYAQCSSLKLEYCNKTEKAIDTNEIIDMVHRLEFNCDIREGYAFRGERNPNVDLVHYGVDFDNILDNAPVHYICNIGGGHLTMVTILKCDGMCTLYYTDTLNSCISSDTYTILQYMYARVTGAD